MTNDLEQTLADAAVEEQQSVDITEITAMAEKQIELQGELDALMEKVKAKKEQLDEIQLDKLPAAMKAARQKMFELENGMKVEVKEEMSISVPKKRLPEIIAKIRSWGFDGIVTNQVVVDIDKGQDNLAGELMGKVEELGLEAKRGENVNSASVKKILNERRREGKNDELGFFGAYLVTKATVK